MTQSPGLHHYFCLPIHEWCNSHVITVGTLRHRSSMETMTNPISIRRNHIPIIRSTFFFETSNYVYSFVTWFGVMLIFSLHKTVMSSQHKIFSCLHPCFYKMLLRCWKWYVSWYWSNTFFSLIFENQCLSNFQPINLRCFKKTQKYVHILMTQTPVAAIGFLDCLTYDSLLCTCTVS